MISSSIKYDNQYRFGDFIKDEEPSYPLLPLAHTCEAYSFRKISEQNELKVSVDSVFPNESLLYFFYGRPSYRVSTTEKPVSNCAFMPICILVNSEVIERPKRILPFDSGAFHNGLFKNFLHPKMRSSDFFIEPELNMAARLVNKFYGSNKNYFYSRQKSIKVPPFEFEVSSYYNLIQNLGQTDYDDRDCSIEVQLDNSVKLTSDSVLLVVLPGIFLDDTEFRSKIESLSAEVKTYHIHHGQINQYLNSMYEKVASFLDEKSYI